MDIRFGSLRPHRVIVKLVDNRHWHSIHLDQIQSVCERLPTASSGLFETIFIAVFLNYSHLCQCYFFYSYS